jgi:hypothetical protein
MLALVVALVPEAQIALPPFGIDQQLMVVVQSRLELLLRRRPWLDVLSQQHRLADMLQRILCFSSSSL